jgi:hypothetical protein
MHEMNEFVFWQMSNDPDDDDDNPEKQEEFINSSAHLYRSI